MQILDGRIVASTILENIKNQITYSADHEKPMLAVVLVWENPASLSYIRMKEKRAREVGMNFGLYRYDTTITQDELEIAVSELSKNEKIHGIIVQSPLPSHIDPYAVIERIDPLKDVDGFTKTQIGNMFLGHDWLYSCTPKGIITMLKHYDVSIEWKNVVVIGRSNIVGKPMTLMLVNGWATVTSCNSKTKNISEITKKADIIIVAIWKPGFLTREMVSENQIIIDVGCTFVDGIARWDTDFDNIKDYVRAISPVPGGVGPMTVSTLIENTWKAFESKKRDN
jgi:methylenetetrahydrofolate dehydrogenase (NADP+)/methenyltetrahydrofolate cyclohydrolase